MCGIAGVLRPRGRRVNQATLDRMSERIASRGPDGNGTWLGDGVGLAHRRLSIIDLSPAAACPMPNEDGSKIIVFNGEIYNYREIRRLLAERGHTFRSDGDTEAIVHGYEEWGLDVLGRLDGMFAFAIWDAEREHLVLARDRLGEKPLYVGRFGDATYFASSAAAIIEALDQTPAINRDAIDCYLSHGFIPACHSVYDGMRAVEAATVLTIKRDGTSTNARYWRLPSNRFVRIDAAEAERSAETEIVRAVQSRMIADVPVGGLLSGGVDSSLVMAVAARQRPGLRSYSVSFEDPAYDEHPHAQRVARHIGTLHDSITVTERDTLSVLPRLVWEYGQPFGDSSAVPTHLVQVRAKRDVKVVLTGDGGDEAFGGYWRARAARYAELYQRYVPASVRRAFVPNALSVLRRVGAPSLAARWSRLERIATDSPDRQYTNAQTWYEKRLAVSGPALRNSLAEHHPERCFTTANVCEPSDGLVARAMRADYRTQLADDFLVKVDVAGMATGVEARPPLLAPALVELAWRLPDRMKVRLRETKWLLKRIAARYVPRDVIYRPKMGFAIPTPTWFRGRLGEVTQALVNGSRAAAAGWVDPAAIHSALEEHRDGRVDHATRLWLFLWLELWMRVCVERSIAPTETLE
jgi:asparagine synthase (glutamine-hydrolysing)